MRIRSVRPCHPSALNGLLALVLALGCGGEGSDGGGDAGADAATDAGVDAATDAGAAASDSGGPGCDDGCLVDGTCYPDGVADPSDPCAVCDASASATAFSPNDGAPCDDGLFCTAGDVCTAGTCAGTARDCSDGIACTGEETCDESAGRCVAGTTTCTDGRLCDTTTDACVLECVGGSTLCGSTCVDTDHDPSHCGGCDGECDATNAVPVCVDGSCRPLCTSGFGDCDDDASTGCETSLDTVTHCGGCGVECGALERCEGMPRACVPLRTVVFDESHGNPTVYDTLRTQLTTEGYTVVRNTTGPITPSVLVDVAVLVLPIHSITSEYSAAEIDAIEAAVEAGMGLVLITDYAGHHIHAAPIAARFGTSFGATLSITTITIATHPITTGVSEVVRDTGAAITLGAGGESILSAPGGDFFGVIPDGSSETVLGRFVVMTDANIFADVYGGAGNPMTLPEGDNAVLASSTFAWVSERP